MALAAKVRLRKSFLVSADGHAELLVLLLLVFSIQITFYLLIKQLAVQNSEHYKELNQVLLEPERSTDVFTVWGQVYQKPWPRIDYGAYLPEERDSWALCFLEAAYVCSKSSRPWQCAAKF